MAITRLEIELNDLPYIMETGRLAKQANGAVLASQGDTVVLATAVTSGKPREGADFLPLMVDYQEMYYSSGRIPGNYFRREIGRPSEKETLTSRFIDRPLRPLFPEGYFFDTQIIVSALSVDPDIDADVVAITAASAALHVSDIPFGGPIAGVRIGHVGDKFIANPTRSQLMESDLNLIVAGSSEAIVMVEGCASIVSEEVVLEAIFFAQESIQPLIAMQNELREKAGKEKFTVSPPEKNRDLEAKVREAALEPLKDALSIADKMQRTKAKKLLKERVTEEFSEKWPEAQSQISGILKDLEKEIVRNRILNEEIRIDGRKFHEIRPITCEVGVLPRTHGSAIFTRGETQVLAVATLGSSEDEQRIESPAGQEFKHFILHYNFTPFSVGEVRPLRGPARRDIGHGALAERALAAVAPPPEDFLYTIRVVSEVLESNGSSSMATVCGGCMAMMDAGIPVRDMVAGIAMGLIMDEDSGKSVILSDILGDEDHLGDMDFKVAGTQEGITALQMDIKVTGISREILSKALEQAREGREHILSKMQEKIEAPRKELSKYAPRLTSITINPEKIKDVIGPGGKTIKALVASTGAKIDIEDTGEVHVFSTSPEAADQAIKEIERITKEPEVGEVYEGVVKRIVDFGAFVEILPGTDGLLHISQIANYRVNKVRDELKEGDRIKVKVIGIDDQHRIKLSRKALL
ncbi:MAG: polyribonucleotide nucleotidyltransferase [Thermodesulfatator sp.]|nr:MAG: polyribonucleotide nucleotidyltransferase [Thermodesulfatator sp.]